MNRRAYITTTALLALVPPPAADTRSVVEISDMAPLYARPHARQPLKVGRDHIFEHGRAWVVRRRGDWLAIPTTHLPNRRLGWIRRTPARPLTTTRMLVRVDLSTRRVWVTHGTQLLMTAPITIGAAASPTPTGPTSVDAIVPVVPGGPYTLRDYGPVIVALRLAQAQPSPGFPDGGIVAFHGGADPHVGVATSAGCIRMHNTDVLRLTRLVRKGTPVKITR
jgi:lipoprotein-anchoring transpeptidase ErfK/SrfK